MCWTDPLVYNELGVICYLNRNYQAAIDYFQIVLDLCGPNNISETWEATVFNLAHCHRKLRYPFSFFYLCSISVLGFLTTSPFLLTITLEVRDLAGKCPISIADFKGKLQWKRLWKGSFILTSLLTRNK